MGLVKAGNRPVEPPAPEAAPPPPDLPDLLAQVEDGDPAVRRRAARALGTVLGGHPQAVPGLCERLGEEEDHAVRETLLLTLMGLRSRAVAEGLIPHLRSEDAGLRNAVIDALQKMPDAVAPCMEDILHDPDSDVRIFAVNVLAALPHPQGPEWLIDVVEHDDHLNVCVAAVDVLTEVGGPEAAAPLRRLLARFPDEPFLAFAVETALRRIGGN